LVKALLKGKFDNEKFEWYFNLFFHLNLFFMANLNFTGNIPYKTLLDLHNFYLVKKHTILTQAMNKVETKTIWFELNQSFRDFLNELLTDPLVNGVRIYLCAYDDEVVNGIPHRPQFVKQMTVGFVSTKDDHGRNVDYPNSTNKKNLTVALLMAIAMHCLKN
jgi:hypothetical protein